MATWRTETNVRRQSEGAEQVRSKAAAELAAALEDCQHPDTDRITDVTSLCRDCWTTFHHAPTLKLGPSGVRAECSCGWGGMPRYTDAQAYTDHANHREDA